MVAACGAVQRPDGGRGLLGVGAPVPALQGRDQHGNLVVLSFPTTHPTVVYFYPKDSTPGCTKEACAFRDVWRRYEERGIRVIGVSSDDVESHRAFAEEHHLPFELIADESGDWARAFGVSSTFGLYSRVTFLIGRDGRVSKTYEAVDPGLHAIEILQDAGRIDPPHEAVVGSEAGSDNTLLAPAPRLAPPSPPTVALELRLGVSPDAPDTLWLAARLTPPPGAHLSWKHQGESGLPTTVEFFGPSGYRIGPVEYPTPIRLPTSSGRTQLGYDAPIVVLARVTRDDAAPQAAFAQSGSHAVFQVHGSWLSCDTRCIKEEVRAALEWNGAVEPIAELPDWLSRLPDATPPLGLNARLHPEDNVIVFTTPRGWLIEDAFLEADVAPGGSTPPFTSDDAGRFVLTRIPRATPVRVIVKARSTERGTVYFRLPVAR